MARLSGVQVSCTVYVWQKLDIIGVLPKTFSFSVRARILQIMAPASASATTKKTQSLKVMLTKLKGLHASFNNIAKFVDNFPDNSTTSQIAVRLERLDDLWEKISEAFSDVESHEDYVDEEYSVSKERSEFENRFYDVKAFLVDKNTPPLDHSLRHVDTSTNSTMEHVRLPQIRLQSFNGNIDDWLSFRDLFTSLIHRKPELPDVEKFHYLKGCLEGEAKMLIDSLQVTKTNYQIAWELLLKRYNNSKLLKKRQVQSLFKLPSLSEESASELHALLEGFEKAIQTLDQVVQPADYKDLLLVDILSSRLDPCTRRGWEEYSSTKEQDNLQDLTEFLQRRIRVLEVLSNNSLDNRQESAASSKGKQLSIHTSHNAMQSSFPRCHACSEQHFLYLCPVFQKMSIANRESLLRNYSLCRNCLKRGHFAKDCSSKNSCRRCKERHHTMVCYKSDGEESVGRSFEREHSSIENVHQLASTSNVNAAVSKIVTSNVSYKLPTRILLATAVVLLEDSHGVTYSARALLDSGSECNFISENLCQRMNVRRERVAVSVIGIGQSTARVKYKLQATVKSRVCEFSRQLSFLVLPKVTANLPMAPINPTEWNIPDNVALADPFFFQSREVDLVLGIQAFFSFFKTGNELQLGDQLPRLTESVFGWVISGEIAVTTPSLKTFCNLAVSDNLEELLTRFWSCEEVGRAVALSREEMLCEEQFVNSVRRNSDGRYTVKLSKDARVLERLGDSREIALKRFQGLERRLSRDVELQFQYKEFMAEYLRLGHMKKVEEHSTDRLKRCFLPHHAVMKESSSTTRLRVVFDASCKTSTGISLNDALLTGPVIQQDLRTIILRCRIHQIMLVADVEKMFRQINMDSTDSPLQSILWRFDAEDDISVYELSTVTYGTKPALFLATRTLKQLAQDERSRFPLAAKSVEEDTYMDDIITGVEDIETGIELRKQLNSLMASGGFNLRKWASNCSTVLNGINNAELAIPETEEINWEHDATVKALGLTWLPKTDCLRFQFDIPPITKEQPLSKRKILSIIAMLFDPLGLLGATITTAKLFMQQLWSFRDIQEQGLGWDDSLPTAMSEKWRSYHQQLPSLNELRIQRCAIVPNAVCVEFHCFSDASEKAYGACVYIRSVDTGGRIEVHLLTSKSKVAPLKVQSLPRLELCGALLAAELLEKVTESVTIARNIWFWTDSTCVLRWIQASPGNWTTFVANRVAKIQILSENYTWNHVAGIDNPADLISRGISPSAIHRNTLWWEGPTWLKMEPKNWPKREVDTTEELSEKRIRVVATNATEEIVFSNDFISKFSSYTKLIRSTAYWLRLMTILRHASGGLEKEFLTSKELRQAESTIVRMVQLETFANEFREITKGNPVPRASPLRWFNPQISDEGLLCVGGRLQQSQESDRMKHPIILPARHFLTELIIRYYHERLLHAGTQLLLSSIRLRFWPLGGRKLAKKIIHQCQRCFRVKPINIHQQMGELPAARITMSRPFTMTGVDYFGPVYTRAGRKRAPIKSYVAIFICMCTKAVHMEHVSDLSTERFLQALRRFVSRRGKCSDIYSDNGTNFIGARNQMREWLHLIRSRQHQETIVRECAKDSIQWHFNPPSAPHFGGLWEAAVRSAKFHLLRVLGGNPTSSEDFATLLVQVEGCLNSRPLTPHASSFFNWRITSGYCRTRLRNIEVKSLE